MSLADFLGRYLCVDQSGVTAHKIQLLGADDTPWDTWFCEPASKADELAHAIELRFDELLGQWPARDHTVRVVVRDSRDEPLGQQPMTRKGRNTHASRATSNEMELIVQTAQQQAETTRLVLANANMQLEKNTTTLAFLADNLQSALNILTQQQAEKALGGDDEITRAVGEAFAEQIPKLTDAAVEWVKGRNQTEPKVQRGPAAPTNGKAAAIQKRNGT